ncbi:MAG: hypothetical protein R3C68_01105 [Myxococcota bacterium]
MTRLRLSPTNLAQLGINERTDEWDDVSFAAQEEYSKLVAQQLDDLQREINPNELDEPTRLSYDLY